MKIYKINNEKFKSVYFSCNYVVAAKKEDISYYNLVAAILSKSNKIYSSEKKVQEYLYSLYGASFDVNVEKIGDLFNIEFKIEFINSNFLPNKEDVSKKCIKFINDIIYNSVLLDKDMDINILNREKNSILEKIITRKDDRLKYGVNKTEELLCENDTFGTYIYGDEEIVKAAELEDVRKYYDNLINEAEIIMILSGNLSDMDNIDDTIKSIFNSVNKESDFDKLIVNSSSTSNEDGVREVKEILQSAQSVLTMGFKINNVEKEDFFGLNVYNAVLGATPSSKLFQNFREKESLAYTVRSRYYRFKDILIIYAGIERNNYKKAVEVLKREISDIRNKNVSLEEFDAAKESIIAELREVEDSKVASAKYLISNLFYYKDTNMDIEKMIEGISKVTIEEIFALAEKIQLKLIYLLGGEESV